MFYFLLKDLQQLLLGLQRIYELLLNISNKFQLC